MSERREISLGVMATILLICMTVSQCEMSDSMKKLAKCNAAEVSK